MPGRRVEEGGELGVREAGRIGEGIASKGTLGSDVECYPPDFEFDCPSFTSVMMFGRDVDTESYLEI